MSVQQRIRGTQPEVQAGGKVKVVIGEGVAKKLGADIWGWGATFGLGLFCTVVMFFFSYFYPIESQLDVR